MAETMTMTEFRGGGAPANRSLEVFRFTDFRSFSCLL